MKTPSTTDKLYKALAALHACHRAFSGSENWTTLDDEARAVAEAALANYEEKKDTIP